MRKIHLLGLLVLILLLLLAAHPGGPETAASRMTRPTTAEEISPSSSPASNFLPEATLPLARRQEPSQPAGCRVSVLAPDGKTRLAALLDRRADSDAPWLPWGRIPAAGTAIPYGEGGELRGRYQDWTTQPIPWPAEPQEAEEILLRLEWPMPDSGAVITGRVFAQEPLTEYRVVLCQTNSERLSGIQPEAPDQPPSSRWSRSMAVPLDPDGRFLLHLRSPIDFQDKWFRVEIRTAEKFWDEHSTDSANETLWGDGLVWQGTSLMLHEGCWEDLGAIHLPPAPRVQLDLPDLPESAPPSSYTFWFPRLEREARGGIRRLPKEKKSLTVRFGQAWIGEEVTMSVMSGLLHADLDPWVLEPGLHDLGALNLPVPAQVEGVLLANWEPIQGVVACLPSGDNTMPPIGDSFYGMNPFENVSDGWLVTLDEEDNGRFEFNGLPPGPVELVAIVEQDSLLRTARAELFLIPGERQKVEIVVPQAAVILKGQLSKNLAQAASEFSILIAWDGNRILGLSMIEDGVFELPLAEAQPVDLVAWTPEPRARSPFQFARASWEPGQPTTDILLNHAGLDLVYRTPNSADAPCYAWMERLDSGPGFPTASFSRRFRYSGPMSPLRIPLARPGQTRIIRGLPPGRYRFRIFEDGQRLIDEVIREIGM